MPKRKQKPNRNIDLSLEMQPMLQNECLICLSESKTNLINTKNEIFQFSENDIYVIKCKCNVNVHKECMMQWAQTKRACPICLKPFTKLTAVNLQKPTYFDAKLLWYIIVIIVGYKIFML